MLVFSRGGSYVAFFRDWLQDDLMKINTEDDSYPVWVPFSVKVTLQEDGNLKIEEFPDDEPIQDNAGTVKVLKCQMLKSL